MCDVFPRTLADGSRSKCDLILGVTDGSGSICDAVNSWRTGTELTALNDPRMDVCPNATESTEVANGGVSIRGRIGKTGCPLTRRMKKRELLLLGAGSRNYSRV